MLSKKRGVNILPSGISPYWDDTAEWKDLNQALLKQYESPHGGRDKQKSVDILCTQKKKQLTCKKHSYSSSYWLNTLFVFKPRKMGLQWDYCAQLQWWFLSLISLQHGMIQKNCIWGIKLNKILSLTEEGDYLLSARNAPFICVTWFYSFLGCFASHCNRTAHSSTQVLHLLAKEDNNYFLDFVTRGRKSW